jgi:hypothetical protein
VAFPSGTTISTTNLDSSTDSPALARADLFNLAEAVNDIIDSENTANGVVVLNSNGLISTSILPTNIQTATLSLSPVSGFVTVNQCLRLPPKLVADLAGDLPNAQRGDIVSLNDGDDGDPCLAMYDGTNWKVIALGATVSSS